MVHKQYRLIFCFLLILSCVQKSPDKEMTSVMIHEQNDFPFTMEPLPVALMTAFTNVLPDSVLLEYDNMLQPILEKEFDGKKVRFVTKDKSLKVEFSLRESFKIVEKNIYCREYLQHVEFIGEIIDNIGVACRKEGNIWENLVLLTK